MADDQHPESAIRDSRRRWARRRGGLANQFRLLLKGASAIKIIALCLVILAFILIVGLVDALLIDALLVDAPSDGSATESEALFELGVYGIAAIVGTVAGAILVLAIALLWMWYRD